MKRVALYFGSFNPIHNGHVAVAKYIVTHGLTDEVWIVVSPQNPFKSPSDLASEQDRLAMARMATEGQAGISVSDIEFSMPKPSYTVETIDRLRMLYPDTSFSILCGADIADTIRQWRQGERVAAENTIYVYPRRGYACSDSSFVFLPDAPMTDISSTSVRKAVASGKEIGDCVPPQVEKFIKQHRLYVATDR